LKKLLHIYLEGVEEVCLGHFGLHLDQETKTAPSHDQK